MSREGWFLSFLWMGSSPPFADWQTTKFYRTTKPPEEALRLFGNFLLIRIGISSAYLSVWQPFLLSPSMSSSTAAAIKCLPADTAPGQRHLHSFSWKCGCYFPASQHGADPPTDCVLSPCYLAASSMMCEVLLKGPSISKKAPSITCLFSTAPVGVST